MEIEPTAEALEGRRLAAWWLDDAETMFETRERAYRLYRRDGDLRSAGRLATLFGKRAGDFGVRCSPPQ